LAGLAAVVRDGIEMGVAVALALEVHVAIVFHPAEREGAGTIHPGLVVHGGEDAGGSGSGIEGENPAVFVIGGTCEQNRAGAVGGPFGALQGKGAVLRFRGAALGFGAGFGGCLGFEFFGANGAGGLELCP
jgi:hypothetical protein